KLETVALRIARPAEATVRVILDAILDLRPGGAKLRQHRVEILHPVVDHERGLPGTKVSRVGRKGRPDGRLAGTRRGHHPVGLPRLDGNAEMHTIPVRQSFGISRLEEYTANSQHPFHDHLPYRPSADRTASWAARTSGTRSQEFKSHTGGPPAR